MTVANERCRAKKERDSNHKKKLLLEVNNLVYIYINFYEYKSTHLHTFDI